MRLFVAVAASEAVRDVGLRAVEELKPLLPQARWADLRNSHVTLAFLGSVDASRLPALKTIMRESAAQIEPFELEFHGVGAFDSWKNPRVIWIGTGKGAGEAIRLAGLLHERLADHGFPLDSREFHPHLTLGRVNARARLDEAQLGKISAIDRAAAMRVDEIELFESKTLASGAVHTVIVRQRLGSAAKA